MHPSKALLSPRSLIKLFGAMILLLVGILYRVGPLGEEGDKAYFEDYLSNTGDMSVPGDIENSGSLSHGAAPTTTDASSSLHLPIQYDATIAPQEQVDYTQKISDVANFLNTNNKIGPSFSSTIQNISVSANESARRGYATHDHIVFNIIDVQSAQEFLQLVAHEMGHIFDLGFVQGTRPPKDAVFTEFEKPAFLSNDPSLLYYQLSRKSESTRNANQKKKDFCSGYGMSNPFEDFSECFNLYIYHNTLFKFVAKQNETLKKKYNFIATMLQGKYIQGLTKDLAFVKTSTARRPRDTTKIQ